MPYLSAPEGAVLQKFYLKSYLHGYFDCISLSEDRVDYQTFSISRDGYLRITAKSEYNGKSVQLESLNTVIDPKAASDIIDQTFKTLVLTPRTILICDGPSWEMTLTFSDGSRSKIDGCMWADPELNGVRLSEYIRVILQTALTVREYSIIDPWRLALYDGLRDDDEAD